MLIDMSDIYQYVLLLTKLKEIYLQYYFFEQFQLGGIQLSINIRDKIFIASNFAIEALTKSAPSVENLSIFTTTSHVLT